MVIKVFIASLAAPKVLVTPLIAPAINGDANAPPPVYKAVVHEGISSTSGATPTPVANPNAAPPKVNLLALSIKLAPGTPIKSLYALGACFKAPSAP